jgi:hypothetical protein
MNRYGQQTKDIKPWFVRTWILTQRTYIGNLRDVNVSYDTEVEARAAYDAPLNKGETEKVLYHWVKIGAPSQKYVQLARRKKS